MSYYLSTRYLNVQLTLSLLLLCVAGVSLGANPPSILNNSNHLVDVADATLTVLGISHSTTTGPSSTVLAVNQTCPGTCAVFLSPSSAIKYATDTTHVEYAASSTVAVLPSVAYQVINQSSTGYSLGIDQANYPALTNAQIVYSMAYCGSSKSTDYPSVAFVTVLPNTSNALNGSTACGYAQGIEFSIPVDNSNCLPSCRWTPVSGGGSVDLSSPSATTEAMTGVLAAIKSHHPTWTWSDIKSVLRTTASNWSTGYVAYSANGPGYGYGNINYTAANSYNGLVFLQPPGLSILPTSTDTKVTLKLYPFMTSRRAGEVIYSFLDRPLFPAASANNEYTYAQITSIISAYRGTLEYNSAGNSGVQSIAYTAPTRSKRYFVAFTVDNTSNLSAAKFSRAEAFSLLSADLGSKKQAAVILAIFQ